MSSTIMGREFSTAGKSQTISAIDVYKRQARAPFECTNADGAQAREFGQFLLGKPGGLPMPPQQVPEDRRFAASQILRRPTSDCTGERIGCAWFDGRLPGSIISLGGRLAA